MKVVLFDADGVLTLPEEVFSRMYVKERGFDNEPFEEFFRTQWADIVTGKADLKESIEQNPELWQWDGTTDELLQWWFETENVVDESLVKVIAELKEQGVQCYLATDQEKYRVQYMRDVMFPGLFNGYFVSCELGLKKKDPRFFEEVVNQLQVTHPDLDARDIIFFDDTQEKVNSAAASGIDARLYESIDQVKPLLK